MQEYYADVIVDITSEKLDRVFQYRVPETLQGSLEPGMVVEIPFGAGNRKIKGPFIVDHSHWVCQQQIGTD